MFASQRRTLHGHSCPLDPCNVRTRERHSYRVADLHLYAAPVLRQDLDIVQDRPVLEMDRVSADARRNDRKKHQNQSYW
jgi:hypothetical protein